MEPLLTIRDLTVTVNQLEGKKMLLNCVSLEILPLSIVGLVGGSGSGKTTLGLSVLGLLPPALTIQKGNIYFKGENLRGASQEKMR